MRNKYQVIRRTNKRTYYYMRRHKMNEKVLTELSEVVLYYYCFRIQIIIYGISEN